MSDKIRCFIAVDIPDSFKEELKDLLVSLKKHGADVKWVKAENLHVTLKFLGDATGLQVEAVKNSLFQIVKGQKRFTVHLSGLGGFPDLKKPRVIWAGMDEGGEALGVLAAKVQREAETLGFQKEDHEFSAHLTIGRVKSFRKLAPLVKAIETAPFSSRSKFEVDHLTFYKSTLTPQGSLYEPIEIFRF